MQGTPVDVLAKALYTSDTKLQLAATSKFRKILSVFGEFSRYSVLFRRLMASLCCYSKMYYLYQSHW